VYSDSTRECEFNGVANQVEKNLFISFLVCLDYLRDRFLYFESKVEPLRVDLEIHYLNYFVN
jgi:hypothetical protein